MNNVDVTLPVLFDNAVYECEKAIKEIVKKYKLSPDMIEIILEKMLLNVKNKKLTLYATAIYAIADISEERSEKNGD